jgi:hypothetical protein
MLLCSAPVAKSVIADYLAPSKPKRKKRVPREVFPQMGLPQPFSISQTHARDNYSGSVRVFTG